MKRTTIFLDPAVETDLRAIAQQEGVPMAALVREAVTLLVESRKPRSGRRLSFTGVGASGRIDVAERHEELLWRDPHEHKVEGLVAEPESPFPADDGATRAGR